MFRFRVMSFFIFMGIFSLSFQIGATSEVNPDEANDFVQELLSNTQDISSFEIFLNNISVALSMFIPGVGPILGIYSGWSTGFGFAAIATMAPALAEIEPLAIFYYSPYGAMELIAYSISMSRSFHVTFSLVRKIHPKHQIKSSLIEIGIVIGLLIVAGLIEENMINVANQVS